MVWYVWCAWCGWTSTLYVLRLRTGVSQDARSRTPHSLLLPSVCCLDALPLFSPNQPTDRPTDSTGTHICTRAKRRNTIDDALGRQAGRQADQESIRDRKTPHRIPPQQGIWLNRSHHGLCRDPSSKVHTHIQSYPTLFTACSWAWHGIAWRERAYP